MELWIRSQDKMNLVKVRQISVNYQDNKQIIANYMPELYENSGEYYEILGTYKTKERALEVLDEIQEAKLGNFHYKCPSNVKVSNNEDTIIYQMPAE